MPPKVQFTKEQIIQAAFDYSIENGLQNLTVRKLAAKLGCSVAPIYVNFQNSAELVRTVIERIRQTVWEYSTRPYTETGFFNIGIGQLLFVRDYPLLYQNLLEMSPESLSMPKEHHEQMVEVMLKDPLLEGLNREECGKILFIMSQFTAGLSMSMLKKWLNIPFEEILKIMEETALRLINSMKEKREFKSIVTPELIAKLEK